MVAMVAVMAGWVVTAAALVIRYRAGCPPTLPGTDHLPVMQHRAAIATWVGVGLMVAGLMVMQFQTVE